MYYHICTHRTVTCTAKLVLITYSGLHDCVVVYVHVHVPVYGEEQCEGCHCLLPTRQIVHWPEPLPWSYAVVADAFQVWLLYIHVDRQNIIHVYHE